MKQSNFFAFCRIAAALWLLACAPSRAMTYYLVDNGADWPTDIRNRIIAAMDEAVAVYNAQGYFDVNVRVYYHPGIPTAQADYNGTLGFGGSINARVAVHEISHYLGTGTVGQWNSKFTDGIWNGFAARHFMKLYDGPGGELRQSNVHYYPYGLNYDSEDSPQNRIREVKLVAAMRFDMGIVGDSDGDTLPDEWERFRFGNLAQFTTGDPDGDGISNYDEWLTESDPMLAAPVKHGRTYLIRARHSQKVLEPENPNAGARIRQNASTGSALQKWTVFYVSGGYWKFVNLASGKVLETTSFSNDPGADIIQWNDVGYDHQQWRLVQDGAIYWKIFNKGSRNMVIDVDGGTGATGNLTYTSQYFDVLGGTNQDWAFDDVTAGSTPGALVAEYKLDGTGRDNSGRNLHGIVSGGVTYTTGRVDGQAATFNGTSGSVEIPASIDTSFSIACWVKTTATGGGTQWYNGMGLVDGEVGGPAADFGLALVGNKAGFGTGNSDFTLTSTVAINDGVWHHLVATLNTTTGAMRIYVDGVLQASGAGSSGVRIAPTKLRLGSIGGVTGFLNGSLDEVRLYNAVLTQTEITRLATVGQTLVANYSFDGNTQDASKHGNHGDPTAVAYTTGNIGTSAAQLNGTGSFVKIPASVVGDFTVAYWMKTTATGGAGQWYSGKAMLDADLPGSVEDWGISLVGNKAAFGVGNVDRTILSTTVVNDGNWHHIIATRTNSTGLLRLYVDGALQASASGPTAQRTAPGGLRVGSALYGGAYFAGTIDDLRIYNYPLGNSQAAALANTLPTPWTSADLGNPGSDGYAGYAAAGAGTFTVVGGGTDIGGTSDQFNFVSRAATGNQTVVARLNSAPVSVTGTPLLNAKAGLMFRDSAAANAAFVSLTYDQTFGLRFSYRDTVGGSAGQVGSNVPVTAPVWLRLLRNGNTFTASYATTTAAPLSGDWIALGSHDTALVANPPAGLAITSRNAAQVATTTFGSVTISPTLTAPGDIWRQDYFGTAANSGDAADEADPDDDGLTNVIERALNLRPNVVNAAADRPVFSRDENFLTLTYTKSLAATDLGYQVVWSNNLTTWSSANVVDEVIGSTPTTETHLAKVPLSIVDPERAFLRLEVEP